MESFIASYRNFHVGHIATTEHGQVNYTRRKQLLCLRVKCPLAFEKRINFLWAQFTRRHHWTGSWTDSEVWCVLIDSVEWYNHLPNCPVPITVSNHTLFSFEYDLEYKLANGTRLKTTLKFRGSELGMTNCLVNYVHVKNTHGSYDFPFRITHLNTL